MFIHVSWFASINPIHRLLDFLLCDNSLLMAHNTLHPFPDTDPYLWELALWKGIEMELRSEREEATIEVEGAWLVCIHAEIGIPWRRAWYLYTALYYCEVFSQTEAVRRTLKKGRNEQKRGR